MKNLIKLTTLSLLFSISVMASHRDPSESDENKSRPQEQSERLKLATEPKAAPLNERTGGWWSTKAKVAGSIATGVTCYGVCIMFANFMQNGGISGNAAIGNHHNGENLTAGNPGNPPSGNDFDIAKKCGGVSTTCVTGMWAALRYQEKRTASPQDSKDESKTDKK